jgi:PAS domain-containing protein
MSARAGALASGGSTNVKDGRLVIIAESRRARPRRPLSTDGMRGACVASVTDRVVAGGRRGGLLAAVLRAAAQPIRVVDPDGPIRFTNPLGYDDADELLGSESHETIHYQHPDGASYPASECPCCCREQPARRARASSTGSFAATDRCSRSPTRRSRSRCRRAVARSWPFTDIEDRLRAERVLRERDASSRRSRTRCAGWRRSSPAERRRPRCSPQSPEKSRTYSVFRWSRCLAMSPMGRPRSSVPGASARICFQPGLRWPLDGPDDLGSGVADRSGQRGSTPTRASVARSPAPPARRGSARPRAPRSSSTASSSSATRSSPRFAASSESPSWRSLCSWSTGCGSSDAIPHPAPLARRSRHQHARRFLPRPSRSPRGPGRSSRRRVGSWTRPRAAVRWSSSSANTRRCDASRRLLLASRRQTRCSRSSRRRPAACWARA